MPLETGGGPRGGGEVRDARVASWDVAVGAVVVQATGCFVPAERGAVGGSWDVSGNVVVDVLHAGDHRDGGNAGECAVRDGRDVRARRHVAGQAEEALGARHLHERLERRRAVGRLGGGRGGGAARHERARGAADASAAMLASASAARASSRSVGAPSPRARVAASSSFKISALRESSASAFIPPVVAFAARSGQTPAGSRDQQCARLGARRRADSALRTAARVRSAYVTRALIDQSQV